VLKVNLDAAKNRAESVTYIDASGREFEQPGGLVILAAYALGNVHLMLWSGIGRPYDPVTGEGVVGRNYAYQIGSGATVFFDETTWMNPFMAAGALGMVIDDFNTGSFDHGKEGFIGGGGISTPSATGRPIGFRPVPRLTGKLSPRIPRKSPLSASLTEPCAPPAAFDHEFDELGWLAGAL
jgi:gluconate 2-dehydrogenase alpha chain